MLRVMASSKLSEKELFDIKSQVLIQRMEYLCEELGDPARYYAALRSKGVLSPEDIERVKAKVTSREKVQELVELIHKRRSDKDGHALDVLMDALKKQRVQAHIARELHRALARAREKKGGSVLSMRGSDHTLGIQTPFTPGSPPTLYTTGGQVTGTVQPPLNSSSSEITPTSSIAAEEFETHPEFGALPNLPPGRQASTAHRHPPVAQPSNNIHPRYGQLPSKPPPRQGSQQFTMQSVPEAAGQPEVPVMVGLSRPSLDSKDAYSSLDPSLSYQSTTTFTGNGRYHSPGEEEGHYYDLSDRQSTTTASGTMYSGSSAGSGRDYSEACSRRRLEDQLEEVEMTLHARAETISQLTNQNHQLSQDLRATNDRYEDLLKQNAQMADQLRQKRLSEQQHMMESFQKGSEPASLKQRVAELEEENRSLTSQLEQYQHENQQLQLQSISSTSSRPQHLPISVITVPPSSLLQHHPYTPGNKQADTPATIAITPAKNTRVGDHLSQHNIHIQQVRQAHRKQSPLVSPGKDLGGKRFSSSSGETPVGEGSLLSSSNSSVNSMPGAGRGAPAVTLQPTPGTEHSTMV